MSVSNIDLLARKSNFHDYEIFDVSIDRFEKNVTITLLEPSTSDKVSILFLGVERFSLMGMSLQNVVLDLMIFESDCDSDYYSRACELLNGSPTMLSKMKPFTLVYFEPSFGAEVACLCSAIEFHQA